MREPIDEIAFGAAWMELRAQAQAGAPEDRDHAAAVGSWLQHWLSQAQRDLDPAITAFVAACAERERAVLAGATDLEPLRDECPWDSRLG